MKAKIRERMDRLVRAAGPHIVLAGQAVLLPRPKRPLRPRPAAEAHMEAAFARIESEPPCSVCGGAEPRSHAFDKLHAQPLIPLE